MSSYLSNAIRLQLMATARRFLKQTCIIDENRAATGEYGEPVQNWARIATDAPCRVIQASSRGTSAVNEAGAQENIQEEYRLEVATDIELQSDMRVTVNGEVYFIVRIEKKLTDEIFRQAVMTKRT
ncbi:MAG: hypothetical protein E6Q97_30535 [Desulfurellales bacterium]|nr:MAG: hypothetical protein E6Q97_30535 [Desulfurellales bacterium]